MALLICVGLMVLLPTGAISITMVAVSTIAVGVYALVMLIGALRGPRNLNAENRGRLL